MNDFLDHLPRLRRYARALTGDRYAAEDLVQDTLERALSRMPLFRRGSRLDAWLLTIMHNVFVSQLRQRASQAPTVALEEQADQVCGQDLQTDALVLRDLDRALARLPLEQREVLLLVSLEELSYEETARILAIPVGTVMSRLSRGRERLRLLLAGAPVPASEPAPLKVIK